MDDDRTAAAEATIEAVIVNHNTSAFSELCLRSLYATESPLGSGLSVTVIDNHSGDPGIGDLHRAAVELGARLETSRWPAEEATVNTHGDVLRDFVLARPEASYYLFLDADIVFIHRATLTTMRADLDGRQDRWAVQARFAGTERNRGPGASLDIGHGDPMDLYAGFEGTEWHFTVHGTGKRRVHPGCALITNSPALQRTAATAGFATAVSLSQDASVAGYYDTMALASMVMATHGQSYALSTAEVVHYYNISYDDRTELTREKLADCHRRLALLRADPSATPPAGPWG